MQDYPNIIAKFQGLNTLNLLKCEAHTHTNHHVFQSKYFNNLNINDQYVKNKILVMLTVYTLLW